MQITLLPSLFQESQLNTSCHKKNVIQLRKLLKSQPLEQFQLAFMQCLNEVLTIKKKEVTVERLLKFITLFIQYLQEKGADDETGSEFTKFYLKVIAKGLRVKEKAVRLRCCQLLAKSMDALSEMDDDLYESLQELLLERVRDKEPAIRVQAAIALSKFQNSEETKNEEDVIEETLLYLLRNDSSSEVRKAVLSNLEINKKTIPYIVERARDVDAHKRIFVFKKSMVAIGDMRVFSIEDRERILTWGLNDRDSGVKKACTEMLCHHWIQQCDMNIIDFLSKLDVLTSQIAEKTLKAFLSVYPDFEIELDDLFWDNLTPETAFFVFVYFQQLKEKNQDESDLVELSQHVQRLSTYLTKYEKIPEEDEEEKENYDFICSQLLKLTLLLDFGDETGRRNLQHLLKTELLTRETSLNHLGHFIDILKKMENNEKKFIQTILEILSDIRQLESRQEQHYEIEFRSLEILKATLERCQLPLSQLSPLSDQLSQLVVPCLTNEEEASLQILALECLIQFCLMDKDLAQQNFDFLFETLKSTDEQEIVQLILRASFDLFSLFGLDHFSSLECFDECFSLLIDMSLDEEMEDWLTTCIEGFCKLNLQGHFQIQLQSKEVKEKLEKLFTKMFFIYFNTCFLSDKMATLNQILTVFWQAFCFSSLQNQQWISFIFGRIIYDLIDAEEADDNENVNIKLTPLQIALQFLEWIDPANLLQPLPKLELNHLAQLASQLLQSSVNESETKKKFCIKIISRLPSLNHFGKSCDSAVLKELVENIDEWLSQNERRETVLEKILTMIQASQEVQSGPEDEEEAVEEEIKEQHEQEDEDMEVELVENIDVDDSFIY